MIQKLNVYYKEIKVGELIRDNQLMHTFRYSDSWIDHSESFQLSLALPLMKNVSFKNKVTLSFFENLIPEGDFKTSIEKTYNIKSTFEFLKAFGQECAGAITLSADSPTEDTNEVKRILVDTSKINEIIEDKKSVAELMSDQNTGYLSLAGAQDKFAAIVENNKVYLPFGTTPSTHIVKMPIHRSDIKESVYNEYYCMKLAQRVGLIIPDVRIIKNDFHSIFVIKRYDRSLDSQNNVQRLHQQDFCQAQGYISEEKYESFGGPTILDNYKTIIKNVNIKNRRDSINQFLDWICFNIIIGNNDSHSKNLSLLLINRSIVLAPFYDLLCTEIYPKLQKRFSFTVGGSDDASRVGKKELLALEVILGLKSGAIVERMQNLREKILIQKDKVASEVIADYPETKIVTRISKLIGNRCKGLLRQGIEPLN